MNIYKKFNNEYKCIYIHIPKIAGISIEQALFNEKVGHKKIIDFLNEDKEKCHEYFKFTFVRNPYDRLASAFYFLKDGGRNKFDKAWADERLSDINSFENFVIRLKDLEFRKKIIGATHFIPQYKFITDPNGKLIMDYIGRFETLNDDFDFVCKKLNKNVILPHKNKTNSKKHYQDLYTKETQEIVYNIYKKDFELLNYSYDLENKQKDIFIHVGYPKAASTTLQKHLFNKHKELLNLGLYPRLNIGNDTDDIDKDAIFIKDDRIKEFYNILTLSGDNEYLKKDIQSFYEQYIKHYLDSTEKKIIFSHERFTSVFFAFKEYEKKAKRLHDLFPNGKIILVIRNQYDWLKSQYRDHPFNPRHFHKGKMISFDEWFEIVYKENDNIKLLSILKYTDIIHMYENIFGKNNIGVFIFEELAYDVENFSSKLSHFMNIDETTTKELLALKHENVGVGHLYNIYRGFKRNAKINKLITKFNLNVIDRKIEKFIKKSHKKNYELSKKNKKILDDYFYESNKKLIDEYNLNIKNKGYINESK